MTTANDREATLRRALLSAAEYIEPTPGGLERIQERLGRPRPLLVAQLEAAWTVLLMRAPDVIEAIRCRAAKVLGLVWDRFGPKPVPRQGPQWLSWLRPLVAMSVAVFVLGAGVYIGLANPQGGRGVSYGSMPGAGGSNPVGGAQSGSGTTDGGGSRSTYPTAPSSPGSSPSCTPSLSPFRPGQVSPAPSIQPGSATPTPSDSTPSPSPTTPSNSTSTSPSASTPPSSENSGAAPQAGVTSGIPAAGGNAGTSDTGLSGSLGTTHTARHSAGNLSASQSASPSPGQAGKSLASNNSQKNNPCQTPKPKRQHKKKTSLTRIVRLTSPRVALIKLTQTRPGRPAAAKLD
jgi:hypothetical protein